MLDARASSIEHLNHSAVGHRMKNEEEKKKKKKKKRRRRRNEKKKKKKRSLKI